MSDPKPSVTLDMSGLTCPAPLLGAKKVVDDLKAGESLLLISDCPGTGDDLNAWANLTGNEVASAESLGGQKTGYLIRKGGAAHPSANVTLDIRGVSCPGPILEAKKILDGMAAGEVLLLISDCPGSPSDVEAWSRTSSHIVLASKREAGRGTHEFYLRKV
ncbi:MAG: sulfurtransferase TusA family protein [Rhodocyclaceae bacterium]